MIVLQLIFKTSAIFRSIEGEVVSHYQHQLKLENNGNVLVIFPIVFCHIIDEFSPLYQVSAMHMLDKKYIICFLVFFQFIRNFIHFRFEIVVCLSGSSRETGQLTEARTSYLPKEIHWGYRFKEIVEYDYEEGSYSVDYLRFDELVKIATPLFSAMELDNILQQYQDTSEQQTETNDVKKNLNSRIFPYKTVNIVSDFQWNIFGPSRDK